MRAFFKESRNKQTLRSTAEAKKYVVLSILERGENPAHDTTSSSLSLAIAYCRRVHKLRWSKRFIVLVRFIAQERI